MNKIFLKTTGLVILWSSSLLHSAWPSRETLILELALKPALNAAAIGSAGLLGYFLNKKIAKYESKKMAKKLITKPVAFKNKLIFDTQQQLLIDQLLFCIKHKIPFPGGSVLFYGPPGNGKSTIVNYIAHVSGADILVVTPSNLCSANFGSSNMNLSGAVAAKAIFNVAQEHAASSNKPLIIFCDEVDFACLKRNEIQDFTLKGLCAEMLVQLSDIKSNNIFIFGATNYLELLDGAMTRDARFGNIFLMKNPSVEHVFNIYKDLLKDSKLHITESELKVIAQQAQGLPMASIAESVKRATINTAYEIKLTPKGSTTTTSLVNQISSNHKQLFITNLKNAIKLSFRNYNICNPSKGSLTKNNQAKKYN